jgi:DNA polymerase-3 subunit epsilon
LARAPFVAAHNASFERSVINACLEKHGRAATDITFLCTLKLSRMAFDLPANGLADVAEHLGIELNHHDAKSDAEACARIVLEGHGLVDDLSAAYLGPRRAKRAR